MSDYAKIVTQITYSANSDYSSPEMTETFTQETEPSFFDKKKVQVATGGTTVDLGHFNSVADCIIHNNDESNYVDITFYDSANSPTVNTVRVEAGQTRSLGEITVANDLVLTADTAACYVEIVIFGA